MICPNCGKEARDPLLYCDYCHEERVIVDFIDPAELLCLIESFIESNQNEPPGKVWELAYSIKSALSGDPEPLEKLAGEK